MQVKKSFPDGSRLPFGLYRGVRELGGTFGTSLPYRSIGSYAGPHPTYNHRSKPCCKPPL